jgi:hypothetical protein
MLSNANGRSGSQPVRLGASTSRLQVHREPTLLAHVSTSPSGHKTDNLDRGDGAPRGNTAIKSIRTLAIGPQLMQPAAALRVIF